MILLLTINPFKGIAPYMWFSVQEYR